MRQKFREIQSVALFFLAKNTNSISTGLEELVDPRSVHNVKRCTEILSISRSYPILAVARLE